jgi:hypothetical protein
MKITFTCYTSELSIIHIIRLITSVVRLRLSLLSLASFCCPNELRIHLLCQWIIDDILYSIHKSTSIVVGIHLYTSESSTIHIIRLITSVVLRLRSSLLNIASICSANEDWIHLLCQRIIDNLRYSSHGSTSIIVGLHLHLLRQRRLHSLAMPVNHRQYTLFHPRVHFHGR